MNLVYVMFICCIAIFTDACMYMNTFIHIYIFYCCFSTFYFDSQSDEDPVDVEGDPGDVEDNGEEVPLVLPSPTAPAAVVPMSLPAPAAPAAPAAAPLVSVVSDILLGQSD